MTSSPDMLVSVGISMSLWMGEEPVKKERQNL